MPTDDEYNDAETVRRRDEVLKQMLNTAPQPRVAHPQVRPAKGPKKAAVARTSGRSKRGPAAS